MAEFFENIDPEFAANIEQLSRLSYELRENRNTVLAFHGVEDEGMLLSRIKTGDVEEHPAYEHYLAARILDDTRSDTRTALADSLRKSGRT